MPADIVTFLIAIDLQNRIAKLRPLLEGKLNVDIDRFVSAYLKTVPGGAAAVFNPSKKDENMMLIQRLIELFARIDANGSGTVDFAEITQFAADNAFSGGSESLGRALASVVYRESEKMHVPNSKDLPVTRITCCKWVPELQQLFVTYEGYATVFVFNHLCRLVARIHANTPPADAPTSAANLVSEKAKAELAEKYRSRVNVQDAIGVSKVEAEIRHQSLPTTTTSSPRRPADDDDDGIAPSPSRGGTADEEAERAAREEAIMALDDRPSLTGFDDAAKPPSNDGEVAWALHVLRQRAATAPGERMKAAAILANARQIAEARKSSLLAELGARVGKHGTTLTLKQQQALEEEIKRNSRILAGPGHGHVHAEGGAGSQKELEAMRRRQAELMEAVQHTVESRHQELNMRRSYAVERATTKTVLLAHPAGFTLQQAERLKKVTVKELSQAGDKLLPIMGIKNTGSAMWGKASKLFRQGSASDMSTASAMAATMAERMEMPHIEGVSAGSPAPLRRSGEGGKESGQGGAGKPQAAASAAMIAFDPGPQGKTRDFGYLMESQPRFSIAKQKRAKSKATGAGGSGSAGGGGGDGNPVAQAVGAVARELNKDGGPVVSRVEALSMPRGKKADVTLLGVEYCMPVDRAFASDAKTWRQIAATDVRHLIAVSSSELVITLWSTRSFEYGGVIHSLLPQDRMCWSTGANMLLTCNSFVGPVSGWDVLTGSKLISLHKHTQPVQCIVDVSSMGVFCTGALDGQIHVWGYRNDSDILGGELAGIRGRAPPKKPVHTHTLAGHTSGVLHMAAIDDAIAGKLVSAALGSELCVWDLSHMMLMAKVSSSGKDAGVNALAITSTTPPYAVTVDDTNMVRLWGLDVGDGKAAMAECLDIYRIQDMPNNGIVSIAVPSPHPHLIAGGRRLLMLGPAPPNAEEAPGGAGAGVAAGGFLVPVASCYSEEMAAILIAEGDGVTIYDARSGSRVRRIPNLLPQMLVSLAIEGSGRKALCGDAGGDMILFNILDGRVLAKAKPPHGDDITRIIPVREDGLVVTASWDRSIRVYDLVAGRETGHEEDIPCVRIVQNAHSADITCMDVSRSLGLVASGATDGTCRVWDLCTLDLQAVLVGHNHGITQVAFPGPAPIPLLVTADDGGFINIWAVRGSTYTDRLMMSLRNFGRQSGAPPPSMNVIDLAALKHEEKRKRVAVVKGGLISIQKFTDASEGSMDDNELSALFKKQQAKVEHERRQAAITGTLRHQIKVALTAKSEGGDNAASDDPNAASAGSGSAAGTGLEDAHRSPAASPGKASPRRGAASRGQATEREAAPTPREPDGVPVPITALAVYCVPANQESLDDVGMSSSLVNDHSAQPVMFKIFSGDGQGVLKQWDLSSHVNKFGTGGFTGINIIPPSKLCFNQLSWNPRQTKHRVYPEEGPAAFDPEVEAAKAAAALASRRISSIGKRQEKKVVSEDALRSSQMLARLRMQRTLYSNTHPNKSNLKLDAKLNESRNMSSTAAERIAIAKAKADGTYVEGPPKEEEVDAADRSPLAMKPQRAQQQHARRPSSAGSTRSGAPTPRFDASASPGTPSRTQHGSNSSNNSNTRPSARQEVHYPKVDNFLGAVVYSKLSVRSKQAPLVPVFASPSIDVPRKLQGIGMRLEGDEEPQKPVGARLPSARTSTGAAAALLAITQKASVALFPRSRPPSATAPLTARAEDFGPAITYTSFDEVPRDIQDDLWYCFKSDKPEYHRAKASLQVLAEAAGKDKGWMVEVEDPDAAAGNTSRPSSAASITSTTGGRRLMTKNVAKVTRFDVPTAAWVASRLRLDIKPQSVWTGHTDVVNHLTFIQDPISLMSSSLDGSVRMWAPNGLPMSVVSSPPRNIELERAMAAAAQVMADAGAAGHGEEAFKIVPNLRKEETPWQFVPNDEAKVDRIQKQAQLLWTRLTSMKPGRRASVVLSAAAHQSAAATSGSSASESTSGSLLSRVAAMGRRASVQAANDQVKNNKQLQEAEQATARAEAMMIQADDASQPGSSRSTAAGALSTARSMVSRSSRDGGSSSRRPSQADQDAAAVEAAILAAGAEPDAADERASKALNMALIHAIENWDAETTLQPSAGASAVGRRSSQIKSSTTTSLFTPIKPRRASQFGQHRSEQDAQPDGGGGAPPFAGDDGPPSPLGRAVDDAEMMRRYPHLAVEANLAASRYHTVDRVAGLTKDDAQHLGILDRTFGSAVEEEKKDDGLHNRQTLRPGTAGGNRGPARPGSAALRGVTGRPASAAGGARPMTIAGYQSPVVVMPYPHLGQQEVAVGLNAAMSFVHPSMQYGSGGIASAASARPSTSSQLQRPGSAGRGGSSGSASAPALARPTSANGYKSYQQLKVSAAAVKAGSALDDLFDGPPEQLHSTATATAALAATPRRASSSSEVRRPSFTPLNLSAVSAADATAAAFADAVTGIADTYATDRTDGANQQEDAAERARLEGERARLASTLSRVHGVLSSREGPTVHVQVRRRVDDVLTAASMGLVDVAAPLRPSRPGSAATVRPQTAGFAIGTAVAAGPTQAWGDATPSPSPSAAAAGGLSTTMMTTGASKALSQRPGTAKSRSRSPARGGGSTRPGTAGGFSTSSALTEPMPEGLPQWEALLWPHRRYNPPKVRKRGIAFVGLLVLVPLTVIFVMLPSISSIHLLYDERTANHLPPPSPSISFPPSRVQTFGMYTRAAIDKFRHTWNALDSDGSGAVDVEELLNAKIFASSTLKVTKAIFATIDSDKSGDVSLQELVKVAFPLGGPDLRKEIIRYMKYSDVLDKAEAIKGKEEEHEEAIFGSSGDSPNNGSRSRKRSPRNRKAGTQAPGQQHHSTPTAKVLDPLGASALQAIEMSRSSRKTRAQASQMLDDMIEEDM